MLKIIFHKYGSGEASKGLAIFLQLADQTGFGQKCLNFRTVARPDRWPDNTSSKILKSHGIFKTLAGKIEEELKLHTLNVSPKVSQMKQKSP